MVRVGNSSSTCTRIFRQQHSLLWVVDNKNSCNLSFYLNDIVVACSLACLRAAPNSNVMLITTGCWLACLCACVLDKLIHVACPVSIHLVTQDMEDYTVLGVEMLQLPLKETDMVTITCTSLYHPTSLLNNYYFV